MIAEIAELFGSRLAPRRSRTARRRRPTGRGIGMESLESRRLLDANNGYIKIDLSQLDQTNLGEKYNIYMLGYASSSGQILQQDPVSKKISLRSPVPADTVVNVTPTMVSGSSVTLSTNANLFVGGDVTFSNGTKSTIASIAANVVTAAQVTGSVQSVTVTAKGSGYTSAPTVTIEDTANGPGQGATAVAVLGTGDDSDKVVGIRLTNLGQNYSQANVSITLTGGGGNNATASLVINSASVFAPVQPTGWKPNADAAILGAASVNQGTVSNPTTTTSQVTDVPITAGVQSGIRLDSLVTGYFNPSGKMPTADAQVTGSKVTGLINLVTNSGQYQYAPTVTFPGDPGAGVTEVATGLCTIDPTTGFVNGITFTPTAEYPNLTAGAGYDPSKTYAANFSNAPSNTFFYPTDPNGFPGHTGAAAAAVTSLTTGAGKMTIDLSQSVASPPWAPQPPITLYPSALKIFTGGTSADGFATFVPMATVTVMNGAGATPTNLNTATQFDPKALPMMTVPTAGIDSQNYAAGTPTLDANGRLTDITFSQTAFSQYRDGTYAIFASAFSALTPLGTPSFTVSNLLSTSAVEAYDVAYNIAGSSLAVEGAPGTSTIYSIPSYTITFTDAVPAGTTSLSFSPDAAGTVSGDGSSLTISTGNGGYPGIASGLAIGMTPPISLADGPQTTQTIAALAISGTTITVTFDNPLSTSFRGKPVSVRLPPTGGSLPVIKWDAVNNNAIWAEQTPNPKTGSISVNGARIYFILDTLNLGPPAFDYAVSVDATGDETITVTQPPDALVWSGQVSPFQYVELTADALKPSGDGLVYVDLSAVDGFFVPAALSSGTLLMGQPWEVTPPYTSPNKQPITYPAVTRTQILDAWNTFFSTDAAANFVGTGAAELGQAYAALQVISNAGIQNPSFAYATPTTKFPAFDSCWDTALDALYATDNQIDLIGEVLSGGSGGQTAYNNGAQTTVKGYPAIEFTAYSTNYQQNPTGAKFWVFDPRNPPPSEANAFAIDNGVSTKMTTGYQIFANTGVYNSGSIITSGITPNYLAATTATPWDPKDALKQLLSLERQVVTALNRGVGEFGIGTVSDGHSTNAPGPGVTSKYWSNEANWYHYAAPYSAATPQNIFSQWVHTAVIDVPTKTYFATYPLGGGYGEPAQAWGSGGPGTGPFMNQTYGFGYDETPNNGANVPSKILPLQNTAGNQADPLTFQLVFGPWSDPPPSLESIDTTTPQVDSTPTTATSKTRSWTVTFSEAVSGVTASNVQSVTGVTDGIPALSALTVTPVGTAPTKTWTVAGTILGSGAAETRVDLVNNNGITDSASQPLSTPTFQGQTYAYAVPGITNINRSQGSVNGGTVVTISGTGFNNTSTVTFGTVAATNVTYDSTAKTLTAASPPQAAGTVDILVRTGAFTSDAVAADRFTYVATSTPIVHPSAAPLPADAVTLTIVGEHFSPTKTGNTVKLSSGTAIVQSATATSITLLFTSRPTAGPLTATVTTGGASSGAVQVATTYATVTPVTAPLAATAKTLVITGTGFDAKTLANNVVTLSSGAGEVKKATATALKISLTSPPQLGSLRVTSLRVSGVESDGLPVQVATVVPGPASANSQVTASVGEAAVGTPVTVTLQAIDAVGNLVTTGGAKVKFAASSAGKFSSVTDNANGTYTATFTTNRVGAQVFSATVNRVKVTDTATTAFVFTSQFSQPIPGTKWSVARGPGFLTLLNIAIATGPNNNVALYTGAAARNLTVAANVENLEIGEFAGVIARYSSKTSYYQAGLSLESGQYFAVIQAVTPNGTQTLAKVSVGDVGDGFVSFSLSGTSLSLSLNGFQVAQATDSRFQSGRVGISGGSAVGFTNFFAG
ncbi:MAG: invasin domain 3-containing protein [Planctomycetaceae bacterium]